MSVMFFTGCGSEPVTTNDGTKAILLETKTKFQTPTESNTLKTDIVIIPQKAIRMSMTAILGISIAEVLMTPTQITYLLHSTQQYVTGPFNERTLYPLFRKNVDPKILWKILNEQSPASPNLPCAMDSKARIASCKNEKDLKIKWTYEGYEPFKRIDITANQFELNWIFKTQKPYLGSLNETMVLKKPSDYKEIVIK